jgi:hypothetical protein
VGRREALCARSARCASAIPPPGSSPAKQQALGLNRNKTLFPKKGEGEKLREKD